MSNSPERVSEKEKRIAGSQLLRLTKQRLGELFGRPISNADIKTIQTRYRKEHGYKPRLDELVSYAEMDADEKVQKAVASLKEFWECREERSESTKRPEVVRRF